MQPIHSSPAIAFVMNQADTIVQASWLFTAEPSPNQPFGEVLSNHSLAIKDGKIAAIAPTATINKQWQSVVTIQASGKLLLPGFVNTHTHAAMNLLRGIANDLPLMEWLEQHIWPAEMAHVGHAFVHDGSLLAAAEMIRSGTTCFNDMYHFPEATLQAARQAGLRCNLGMIAIDFPSAYAQSAEEYLDKGLALLDQTENDPMTQMLLAPHAPYTVSDSLFERIAELSQQHKLRIHTHLHETAFEVAESQKQYGKRPFQRLLERGVIGPTTIATHMTQLTPEEQQQCADLGVHIAHCAESNMKLASGTCPIHSLAESNVNIAIGTDGAASNNDLDMLAETRSASFLAKLSSGLPTAFSSLQAMQAATYNGAKALGLDKTTGSLKVDKAADFQLMDLSCIETQPCFEPVSAALYSASREQITDVWCNGQRLLKNRQLQTLDKAAILQQAKHWHEKISR